MLYNRITTVQYALFLLLILITGTCPPVFAQETIIVEIDEDEESSNKSKPTSDQVNSCFSHEQKYARLTRRYDRCKVSRGKKATNYNKLKEERDQIFDLLKEVLGPYYTYSYDISGLENSVKMYHESREKEKTYAAEVINIFNSAIFDMKLDLAEAQLGRRKFQLMLEEANNKIAKLKFANSDLKKKTPNISRNSPKAENAIKFVRVTLGNPCGHGQDIHVRNSHPTKRISVTMNQKWEFNSGSPEHRTFNDGIPAKGAVHKGCSRGPYHIWFKNRGPYHFLIKVVSAKFY